MALFKIVAAVTGLALLLEAIGASSVQTKTDDEPTYDVDAGIQKGIQHILRNVQQLLLFDPKMNLTETPDVNYGCRCGGSHCSCCRYVRVFRYRRYCCVHVEYHHHHDSLEFSLKIGRRTLFSREISLLHHPPVCARMPYVSRVTLCLELNDVTIGHSREQACVDVSARMYHYKFRFRMGCFAVVYHDEREEPMPAIELTSDGGPGETASEMELPAADWIEGREDDTPFPDDDGMGVVASKEQPLGDPSQD